MINPSAILKPSTIMAPYPADYRPIPDDLSPYTHPKFHDNCWKFATPRVKYYTNPRVKYRQKEYVADKHQALRENPIGVGCGNSKCKMNCMEVSEEVQRDARMWVMMTIFMSQDYSLLSKWLMRNAIDPKGPWTVQEEYRENRKRLIRLRKPLTKLRAGRGTCVWCRTDRSVFDYRHKWGPLDCPQYKCSLEFLFEQKRPRMAYRYLLITSHGNREVCSSKFREVYDITEKQLDTCQKVVGGVFWKVRRANWYRTCDLRSSNLDMLTCQSIDTEGNS